MCLRHATALELVDRVPHHDFRSADIGHRCPGIQFDVLKERGDNADVPFPGRVPAVNGHQYLNVEVIRPFFKFDAIEQIQGAATAVE